MEYELLSVADMILCSSMSESFLMIFFRESCAARHDIFRMMGLLMIWFAASLPISAYVRGSELQHPHKLGSTLK